jgi:hypothetical protein
MPLTSKMAPRQTKAAACPNRGHDERLFPFGGSTWLWRNCSRNLRALRKSIFGFRLRRVCLPLWLEAYLRSRRRKAPSANASGSAAVIAPSE